MLDNHLLDGFDGDVGIERAAAKGTEIFKRGDKLLVGLALFFDERFKARADLRDAVAEFADGFFPFGNGGRRVFEKELENVDEVFGFREVGAIDALALLIKNRAARFLKENVVLRITGGELEFDFFFEIVGFVFRFPKAVIQTERVEQRAVRFGGSFAFAFDRIFGNEFPIELAGAGFEKLLKCGADSGFVFDAELFELGEILVIGDHAFVRGLERQLRHC